MPKRIVHMFNSFKTDRIENFVMDVYRNLDKEKYQFDFILQDNREPFLEDEIKSLGGNVYKIPEMKKHPIKHVLELRNIIKKNEYTAFHRHATDSLAFVDLIVAKSSKVKNIVVHAYSVFHDKDVLNKLCRNLLYRLSNFHIACDKAAGELLYGNKSFEIINNGIPIASYAYRDENRVEMRERLGYSENDIILGHVGHFDEFQNQRFIIDVFKELKKIDNRYKLLFVGDGALRGELNLYCKENGLDNGVLFLGARKDTNKILQAMDVFLFPSKHDGVETVAFIEAQLSALPCFISKNVSDEAIYNNNILKLGIEEEEKIEWCKHIMALPITTEYRTYINENLYNDYEIKNVVKRICEIYDK